MLVEMMVGWYFKDYLENERIRKKNIVNHATIANLKALKNIIQWDRIEKFWEINLQPVLV